MKSVLRHPVSIIAILVIILLAVIIPSAIQRPANPLQLGDNRVIERDRLAKEYGVSLETANGLMRKLEREKGKSALNSASIADGAYLDFYQIHGDRTPGHQVEFQGTGRYYRAASQIGQNFRQILDRVAKTDGAAWARKEIEQGRDHGFFIIPASLIPGGGTIAKALGRTATSAAGEKRLAVVGTVFPPWTDSSPYRNDRADDGYRDPSACYGVQIGASMLVDGFLPREMDIQHSSSAWLDYVLNPDGSLSANFYPTEYFADSPGGASIGGALGIPGGLATRWSNLHNTAQDNYGGHNEVLFLNDLSNRMFGIGNSSSVADYYYQNTHGHVNIKGDAAAIKGWMQSHHVLDRIPLRASTGGAIQRSYPFIQPGTPLYRPFVHETTHPASTPPSNTGPYVVAASLNDDHLSILFDRAVNDISLGAITVHVDNVTGGNPAVPGDTTLGYPNGLSWRSDPYDNRHWTLRNNGWTWTNGAAPPATVTYPSGRTNLSTWSADMSVRFASPAAGDTNPIAVHIQPGVVYVGSDTAYIGNQNGGSQLWTTSIDTSSGAFHWGTDLLAYSTIQGNLFAAQVNKGAGFTVIPILDETTGPGTYRATSGILGTIESDTYMKGAYTGANTAPTYLWPASDPEKFCRLKSWCYYVHDHGWNRGSDPYQLQHIRNAGNYIDDVGGTAENAADMEDRPYPFDHDASDDANGANGGHILAPPLGQENHTAAMLQDDIGKVLQDEQVALDNYDGVVILFPGTGTGEGGGMDITPHSGASLVGYSLAGGTTAKGGVMVPETAGLSLLAHELGHYVANLPDEYDRDLYLNNGIPAPNPSYFECLMMGDLAVMAHGVRMDAPSCLANGGQWATPIYITQDTPGAQIDAVEGTLRDPQILVLPASPYETRTQAAASSWQEYYLLENRHLNGAQYYGDPSVPGLYIYHIDNRVSAQRSELFPTKILVGSDGKSLLTRLPSGQAGLLQHNGIPFPGSHTDSSAKTWQTRSFGWYPDHWYNAADPVTSMPQTFYAPVAYSNGLPVTGADADHPTVQQYSPTDSFTRVLNISDPASVMTADLYVEPAEVIVEQVAAGAAGGPPTRVGGGLAQGSKDNHVLTLKLTNWSQASHGAAYRSTKDVLIDTINLLESGTSTNDANLDGVSLWADTNSNGVFDVGSDTRLATVKLSGDYANFSGLGYRVPIDTIRYLFLTYDVSRTAQVTPKLTVGGELSKYYDVIPQPPGATQVVARTTTDYVFDTSTYRFPINGTTYTILPAPNVLTVSTNSVAPVSAKQGSTDVVMLKARCATNAADVPAKGVTQLAGVRVWAVNGANSAPATGLGTARMYWDTDDDGKIDATGVGATPLSEATFLPDGADLKAEFTSFPTPVQIFAGTPKTLLFTISLPIDPASLPGLPYPLPATVPPYKNVTLQLREATLASPPASPNRADATPPATGNSFQLVQTGGTAGNDQVDTSTFTAGRQTSNATMITPQNIAPVLSQVSPATDQLQPTSGTQATTYTYKVVYTDADGDPVNPIQVYIDDVPYTMVEDNPAQTDVRLGKTYKFTPPAAAMTPGTHHYYFQASDGAAVAQFKPANVVPPAPTDATLQFIGPAVNHAPTLGTPSVSPSSGPQSDTVPPTGVGTYTFKVTYTDLDNDKPTLINLNVQNTTTGTSSQAFQMVIANSQPTQTPTTGWSAAIPPGTLDYTKGVDFVRVTTFDASGITDIGAGDHAFDVTASDGKETGRAPTSGESQGPLVNDAPNAVSGGFIPVDGDAVIGTRPTISWSPAVDINGPDTPPTLRYRIELTNAVTGGGNPDFTNPVVTGTTAAGTTSFKPTSALAIGTWYYRIITIDQHNAESAAAPAIGPAATYHTRFYVAGNHAPVLAAVSSPLKQLDPLTGKTTDTYTYLVQYSDPDGDAPSPAVQVFIDGTPFNMTKVDPTQTDFTQQNLYRFSTSSLTTGDHQYYFYASDGQASTRLPAGSTTFPGPHVNTPPALSNGNVSPGQGSQTGTYTFSVKYTDADGDAPTGVTAYVQRAYPAGAALQALPLAPTGTPGPADFKLGVVYSYTTVLDGNGITELGAGDHTTYFGAGDGVDTVATATQGNPTINDAPGTVLNGFNPAMDATRGSTSPTISWSPALDINAPDAPNTLRYEIQLTNKSNGTGGADWTQPAYLKFDTAAGVTQFTPAAPLPLGDWWCRIFAEDSHDVDSAWSTTIHFTIHVNHAPTLTAVSLPDLQLSPVSSSTAPGRRSDAYTFKVIYTDADGDPATPVTLYLDGNTYTMAKADPRAADSTLGITYTYTVPAFTLASGNHVYYFAASDGTASTQLKDAGAANFNGPYINTAPVVSAGAVTPTKGEGSATFTFTASYRDVEGTPPASMTVYIANTSVGGAAQAYPMTVVIPVGAPPTYPSAADFQSVAGVTYQCVMAPNPPAQPIVPIGAGDHTYYFSATDGTDPGRYPAGGTLTGPVVNDEPYPVQGGFSPKDGVATNDATPTISWNAASDPDTPDTPNTLSYRVELTNKTTGAPAVPDFTAAFVKFTTGAGTTQYTPATLAAGDWYYRIITIDSHLAESDPAPVSPPNATPYIHFRITTDQAPNAPKSGFSPSNGIEDGHSTNPTLQWDAASDPDYIPPTQTTDAPAVLKYVVQLRKMTDGVTWDPDDNTYDFQYQTAAGTASVNIPNNVASRLTEAKGNQSWFWRVRTIDTSGLQSPWSLVQYFKIDLQLQAQSLAAPQDNPARCVTPASGKLIDTFQFFVVFKDPNNANVTTLGPTGDINLNIRQVDSNGNATGTGSFTVVKMSKQNPADATWDTGVTYTCSLLGSGLGLGAHEYHFTYGGLTYPTATPNLLGPIVKSNLSTTLNFTDATFNTPAPVYEEGQPVYIKLVSPDQNKNPNIPETVTVALSNIAVGGDSMGVVLTETGNDTSTFEALVPTRGGKYTAPPPPAPGTTPTHDTFLTVDAGMGVTLQVKLVDPDAVLLGLSNPTTWTDTASMKDRTAPPALQSGEYNAVQLGDGNGIALDWTGYPYPDLAGVVPATAPDIAGYEIYVLDQGTTPGAPAFGSVATAGVVKIKTITDPGTKAYTIPDSATYHIRPGHQYCVAIVPYDEVPNKIITPVAAKTVVTADTQGPTISAQVPGVGASFVAQNQVITFTLSDAGSGLPDPAPYMPTVVVRPVDTSSWTYGAAIPGNLAAVSGGTSASTSYTWTLASGASLPWNKTVIVEVTANDKSTPTNSLFTGQPPVGASSAWTFTTVTDTVKPKLGDHSPTGANVPITKKITFHLTDDKSGVDPTTVAVSLGMAYTDGNGPQTVTLPIPVSALTRTGSPLDYTYTWDPTTSDIVAYTYPSGSPVKFSDLGGLAYNTTYTVTVDCEDAASNDIDSSGTPAANAWTFKTPLESSDPLADNFVPAKNATNVSRTAPISLRVSDAQTGIDMRTGRWSITVTKAGDTTAVVGTASIAGTAAAPTISFTPSGAGLDPGVRYQATATACDRTPAPRALPAITDWFFTTAALPTFNISGKVTLTDTAATAVVGARIDAVHTGDAFDAAHIVATVFSGGNGSYALPVPAGAYDVRVTKPGMDFVAAPGVIGSYTNITVTNLEVGHKDFKGVLLPYPVDGTIHLGTGVLAGVTVSDNGGHVATSAADGEWSFPAVTNGTYTVTPSLAGYTFTPASASVTVAGAEVSNVDFTAVPNTYTVSGTVTDYAGSPTTPGNPVRGVTISWRSGTDPVLTVQTDALGQFTITGVKSGPLTLTPSLDSHQFVPDHITTTVNGSLTGQNFTAYLTFTKTFGTGLSMVSVPCIPVFPNGQPDTVTNVLQSGVVSRYDPTVPGYAVPGNDPHGLLTHAVPGAGYFVQYDAPGLTLTVPGRAISQTTPVTIGLSSGWNMVGNPYANPLPFGNLVATTGSMKPYAFAYSSATGYVLLSNDASLAPLRNYLNTWEGVWVRTISSAATLQMSFPSGPAASSQDLAKYTVPEGGWIIPVAATTAGRQDLCAACGVIPAATDAFNVDAPPAMNGSVDVVFVDGTGRALKRAIKPTGAGTAAFDMIVRTDISNAQIDLALPDLSHVPANLGVTLVDVDGGKRVYARTLTKYSFQVGDGGGIRHFRIEVAPRTAGNLVISTASASHAQAGMMFTLSVSSDCTVTADIMNISGRVIRRLVTDKALTAGVNTLAWDMRSDTGTVIPAGTYLMRLQAVGADGQRVSAIVNTTVAR